MIKNYFKVAFRNILRNKVYSFINIAGLSIGLASGFIILLYVINELSYDGYNKNLDRIYLLTTESSAMKQTTEWAPFQLGSLLKAQYPEVQESARFECTRCTVKFNDKIFNGVRFCSSDSSLFKILTLPIVTGSLQATFSERNYAVVSSDLAQRCFGSHDPVGETITINCFGKLYNLKVTAVMKDIPRASTCRAEMIVPLFVGEDLLTMILRGQGRTALSSLNFPVVPTYVLLSSSTSAKEFENKLADFSKSVSNPNAPLRFHLFPLKRFYFHSASFANNVFPTGDINNLYIYSAISLLTLLIACINFVILSIGQAAVRTKEIGVRKVIGATRRNIIMQMTAESVFMAVLVLPFAFALVEIFLPRLSRLIGKELPAVYFHHWNFVLVLIGITVIAGVLSGGYVSLYLSRFQPIQVLRDKFMTGSSGATFRKALITIQMIIFIGLITASIATYRQLLYLHNKDFGFNKDNLLVLHKDFVPGADNRLGRDFEAFRSEMKSNPDIVAVSGGTLIPGSGSHNEAIVPDKSDPTRKISFEPLSVDRDFFETMGIKIVYGKSFAMATPEETKNAVIMNESAVRSFGIKNLSQELFNGSRLLGVVKDFNMHSLHEEVAPTVFDNSTEELNEIVIRYRKSADVSKVINFIEARSKDFNGGKPMPYQFFDDRLDNLYGSDYKFAEMIVYFTGLAIFIACLGLMGVSLFATRRRVKEIGVRKAMGASVGSIFYLITKEFIGLLLIAAVISTPMAVYFMNGWMRNYAYHVGFDMYTVACTILAAVVIVLLSVGYQSIKAAKANPVESLRYE